MTSSDPPPTPPRVYIEGAPDGVPPIAAASTSIAAFVGPLAAGPLDEAVRIASTRELESTFGANAAGSETGRALQHFFLNGGTDAWVVRVADSTSGDTLRGRAADRTGLHALEAAPAFNLLCVPQAALLPPE